MRDLTVEDRQYLKQLDEAFDEKAAIQQRLQTSNLNLHLSNERWIREAQRNDRAFRRASILAAIGWAAFWCTALLWWLNR